MKRLVVLIFIGAMVFTFMARRLEHAWAAEHAIARHRLEHERVRPLVLTSYDEQKKQAPRPPLAKRAGGPRERSKTAPAPRPEAIQTNPTVAPEWFPKDAEEESARAKTDAQGYRVYVSDLAGSETKARSELRQKIEREVAQWLAGDVPIGWKPPASTMDRLIKGTYIKPVIEDAGAISKDLDELVTLYRAGARVDFSLAARNEVVAAYNQEVVHERMVKGGSILGFVLIVLLALSGYIRADEATKGYYTNRLRILTAAGVGAAGVVLYQFLV